MKYKKSLFLAGLIILSISLFRATSFAASETAEQKSLLSKIHGSIEHRFFPYFERYRGDDGVVNETFLDLRLQDKLGKNFEYLIAPRVIMDDDHMSSGGVDDIVDDDIRRNIINFKEWYLRYKNDFLIMTAGKQIYSWGTADIFNPTDNLNPRDVTDFIENEKIGVPSFALNLFRNNWKADFILIPVFTPTRIPLVDTRWAPIPPDFSLAINDRDLPDRSINNVQFATRLGATIDGWDLSASYFEGFEYVPAGLISSPIPSSITPVYDKVRIYGMDFSTALKGIEFHGEAAYYNRDNVDRNDYLQYIFGANYTFNDIISDHDAKLTLEYAREEIVNRANNPARYLDLELSHVFRNSIMPKIEYVFDTRKKIEVGLIYNIDHEDYIIQPKFCYKPADNWDIELGLDILEGDAGTVFGRYSKNDRGFVKTKFTF